ncbi:helix-loop-helix protein delilah [Drosophila bipectinata]|uniref:helix-loop-helix protein delilah n=1 Tax=Drosophila bipectinata TaxID=42026 RepID=UPI001C8A8437|nr:helix-loop-helix protein delilah [Drosophila bipectinata]
MKSNTYELHNYADLNVMESPEDSKDSRKRKAASKVEKYSLRQKRQKRNPQSEDVTSANLSDFQLKLDPVVEPVTKSRKNTSTKAKTKAPPLSKYRRKTANARERTRMREINTAFETLRHCVPQAITGEDAANTNEKLTKITTLRLAMKYISMLSEAIQDPSYESEFIGECLEESANRETRLDVEVFDDTELEVEKPKSPPVTKKASKAKGSGKKNSTASKRQSQKQTKSAPQIPPVSSGESCYATSSIGSPASSAYASLSSSSNSSPGLEAECLIGLQGIGDLDTMLMDASDGDSLSCLSPGYESLLTGGGGESLLPGCRGDLPMSGLEKSDVELSLRLLDHHSRDSFDFASDQQPSACISSLASLDGYPFADILHPDFPDMFLT